MTLQKKCSGSEDGKLTDRNKRSTEKIETIKEATLFFSKVTGKEVILKKWRKRDSRLVQMWTMSTKEE